MKEIIQKSFDLSTVAELKFTKVNGEERTMTILAPDAWGIEVREQLEANLFNRAYTDKPPRKVAENIVHVYEKDKGFKSFRSENFISCVPVYSENEIAASQLMTREIDAIVLIDREDGRKFIFSDVCIVNDLHISFDISWEIIDGDKESDSITIAERGDEIFRNFFQAALKKIGENNESD